MKNNITIPLSIFIILFFFPSCTPGENGRITAKKGTIDLSSSTNDCQRNIMLNGEWEFYPGEFFFYQDFLENQKIPGKRLIKVPDTWDLGKNEENCGFGTYRLNVRNCPADKELSLYFHYIFTSYTVYINEMKLCSSGKPGMTRETTTPAFIVQYADFTCPWDEFSIIIHVSNFHHRKGGITHPVYLGTKEGIITLREINLFVTFLIIGFSLLMSFYQFCLFLMKRNNKSTLMFAFLCFFFCLRSLAIDEVFMMKLFPLLPYVVLLKIEYFCNLIITPLLSLFIYYLAPADYSKKILYFTNSIIGVLCIIILASPAIFISRLIFIMVTLCLIPNIYSIYIILKEIKKRNKGAILTLTGMVLLLITVVNDLFYNYQILYTGEYVQFGVLAFIFLQSISLALYLTKALKTKEYLTENLQKEVHEKTRKIKRQYMKQKQFFINFAHETKTPITLISNFFNKYMSQNKHIEILSTIKENIDLFKRNIINLLDLEKMQKKKFLYDHDQYTDFSRLLTVKIPLFNVTMKKRDINMVCHIEKNIFVKADILALDRIVNNIVENSIKYTKSKGTITLILKSSENKVFFTVKDTGSGISEIQLKYIFKPYYQIYSKKRNINGMGLGLNLVNKIIDTLQGKIEIKSKPGRGTKVMVILKKTEIPAAYTFSDRPLQKPFLPGNVNKTIPLPEYNPDKKHILIVEDNMNMLTFLTLELSEKYNITTAMNGEDALMKLPAITKPDIIISDIMMDKMDGYEFFRRLAQHNNFSHIPVIFLTAKMSQEEKIKSLKNGVIEYIHKPFSIEELDARISTILKLITGQKKEAVNQSIGLLQTHLEKNLDKKDTHNELCNFNKIIEEYNITDREKEIINYLVTGYEYKEIAAKLSLSVRTVNNHINNIYKKTGVHNKIELLSLLRGRKRL